MVEMRLDVVRNLWYFSDRWQYLKGIMWSCLDIIRNLMYDIFRSNMRRKTILGPISRDIFMEIFFSEG